MAHFSKNLFNASYRKAIYHLILAMILLALQLKMLWSVTTYKNNILGDMLTVLQSILGQ